MSNPPTTYHFNTNRSSHETYTINIELPYPTQDSQGFPKTSPADLAADHFKNAQMRKIRDCHQSASF